MDVLVVGGAGFVGSHLVDRLLAEGHRVDVVDDLSSGSLANLAEARAAAGGALKFHHLDVLAEEFDELVARREPEVVVHLAVLARRGSRSATATVTLGGTLNLLDAARRAGVRKVVVGIPARHLYGEVPARELPVKEGHGGPVLGVDGVLVRALVDVLGVYRSEHGLEFTALALGSVYGPRQRPDGGVVACFADAVARRVAPELHGDGRQTRDFVFVDDVVDALVRATERGSGLVINIGTGVQTTVREVYELLGGTVPVRSGPRRSDEPGRFAVSPVRARIHLSWAPWTMLRDGLAGLVGDPPLT